MKATVLDSLEFLFFFLLSGQFQDQQLRMEKKNCVKNVAWH